MTSATKRKYQRRASPILCECGELVLAGWMPKHRQSTYHQHHQTIDQLIEEGDSYQDIADLLGVTREAVRQFAVRLGYESAPQKPHEPRVWAPDEFLAQFLQSIEAQGLNWQRYKDALRLIHVEGKLVQLRRGNYDKNGYVQLSGTERADNVDVFVYRLPTKQWLILPKYKAPARSTVFALEPNLDGLGYTQFSSQGEFTRHDYPLYVDAWPVFEKQNPCDERST